MNFIGLAIPILLVIGIIRYYKVHLYELSFEEAPKKKIRIILALMGIVLVVGYSLTFVIGVNMALDGLEAIQKNPDGILILLVSPFGFVYGLVHCKNSIRFSDKELIDYMDNQAYDSRPKGY